MRRGGDRRYQGESEKERRGEMPRLGWDYAFATRGRQSGKWRGRIDCTLSCDPYSFNRKCSRWQSAQFLCVFVSVYACVCVKVWVQQSHQPKPIRLWLQLAQGRPSPSLSAHAVSWSVGSRLSVARPHVPASLITRASDSLIERGQFMNIFQPWLRRQGWRWSCAQRHGARQDGH